MSKKNTMKKATKKITVEKLAKKFSEILKHWVGLTTMQIINYRNATEKDKDICHTHDFCDSNEAMSEAFIKLRGKDMSMQSPSDIKLFNTAWTLAKKNQFYAPASAQHRASKKK